MRKNHTYWCMLEATLPFCHLPNASIWFSSHSLWCEASCWGQSEEILWLCMFYLAWTSVRVKVSRFDTICNSLSSDCQFSLSLPFSRYYDLLKPIPLTITMCNLNCNVYNIKILNIKRHYWIPHILWKWFILCPNNDLSLSLSLKVNWFKGCKIWFSIGTAWFNIGHIWPSKTIIESIYLSVRAISCLKVGIGNGSVLA